MKDGDTDAFSIDFKGMLIDFNYGVLNVWRWAISLIFSPMFDSG